jgi:hypothetical protein
MGDPGKLLNKLANLFIDSKNWGSNATKRKPWIIQGLIIMNHISNNMLGRLMSSPRSVYQ